MSGFIAPHLPFPSGAITIWTGPLSDIPPGWLICDGNNGTPNLLSKFVKSVPDSSTDPGTTGGQNSFTMATGQLPNHGHSASTGDSAGNHSHKVLRGADSEGSGYGGKFDNQYGSSSATSGSGGGHSHGMNVDNAGSSSSIDNTPKHYEVAFIQKA